MKIEELKQIALAAAKNIKTQQDLADFQQMFTKVTVGAASFWMMEIDKIRGNNHCLRCAH